MNTRRAQQAAATMFTAVLASWSATAAADNGPPVKLSRNLICHERGTAAYGATVHYEPFDTLADCIKAGGRVPKSQRAHSVLGPATAAHEPSAPTAKAGNPRRTNGWDVWRRFLNSPEGYIASGAVLWVVLWRAGPFIRRRWRMHVARRRYKKEEQEAARRWRGHKREPSSAARVRRGRAAIGELFAACLNDRKRAERLIEYELKRDSELTREEAVAAALERYRRDNH